MGVTKQRGKKTIQKRTATQGGGGLWPAYYAKGGGGTYSAPKRTRVDGKREGGKWGNRSQGESGKGIVCIFMGSDRGRWSEKDALVCTEGLKNTGGTLAKGRGKARKKHEKEQKNSQATQKV